MVFSAGSQPIGDHRLEANGLLELVGWWNDGEGLMELGMGCFRLLSKGPSVGNWYKPTENPGKLFRQICCQNALNQSKQDLLKLDIRSNHLSLLDHNIHLGLF